MRPNGNRIIMMPSNRLRIDPGNGSLVVEYRIENGLVESRTLGAETGWQLLNADEISSHVMADTAVAYWLRRKMGTRWLIRACTPGLSHRSYAPHAA